jgi:sugar lactone lactonase YvrE
VAPYLPDLDRARLHSRHRSYRSIIVILFFAVLFSALLGCSRAQSQAVTTVTKPAPLEFVEQWGVRGTDPGQFEDPTGPAMDPVGRVYMADRATGFVQKFEANGVPLLSFGNAAARTADSIAVDSGGAIYVANSRAGTMQLFFPEGEPLRAMRIAPQRKTEGAFIFSIDSDGKIYVPDPAGARVQVFSSKGLLQRIWRIAPDDAGKTAQPFAAVADSDAIYVGDGGDGRILKFTLAGEESAVFQEPDPGDASQLLSLAVAAKQLFVLRGFPLRLEVWSEDGRRKVTNALGDRLSEVKSAAYLAGDAAGDLVVLDPESRRVLHFRAHVELP